MAKSSLRRRIALVPGGRDAYLSASGEANEETVMTLEFPTTPAPQTAMETFAKQWSESLGLWESAWRIWAEYLDDLGHAVTPDAVLAANCKLLANCVAAPGYAAGEMQRDTGLVAPTLNA
jgi:hypothetical protein